MLKGTNLSKNYGKGRAVLDRVDIEVAGGTVTALLGSNGCGKSTLLRTLALIEPADAGAVAVDGVVYAQGDASQADPPPWPAVTLVFQQLFLWPHLTVRRNITLPQMESPERQEVGESFERVVRMFELAPLLDRYPNEISLGQRQRVALARALVVRPRYLLLDEVTSALDVEHISVLLRHLKELRDSGLGILLVTHLIGFAREVADRVLFMSDGRVLEEGGPRILVSPKTPALARFLSLVEASDPRSGQLPVVQAQ